MIRWERLYRQGAGIFAVAILFLVTAMGGCGKSGSDTEVSQQDLKRHLANYRSYLIENATDLTRWVREMRGQIVVGDLPRAQSRYATARVQLGQIRPLVEASSLGGFRMVEKGIFGKEATEGLKSVTAELQAETEALQKRLVGIHLQPRQLMAGAVATIRRVATVDLQGREEPYAHIDLVDMAAGIEGAQAAVKATEPLFHDADEAQKLEVAFDKAYRALKPYGFAAREPQTRPAAAGARFVEYSQINPEERKEIGTPLDELLRLLETVERSLQSNP
jgi:iron uptake system component EfeO